MEGEKKLNPHMASLYLDVPKSTLARWRTSNIGPGYYKLGGSVFYTQNDLDLYIDSCKVETNDKS